MTWKLDAMGEKRLATVRPELQKLTRLAVLLSPHPFTIVQGQRTAQQQRAIYNQGRYGNKGPIVTYTLNSKHLGGRALDFAAIDKDGDISWDEKLYPPIAQAFQAASKQLGIGITWGGEWRSQDLGHIELNPERNVNIQPKPDTALLEAIAPTELAAVNHKPSDRPEPPVRADDETRLQWAIRYLEFLGYPRHQAVAIVAHGAWESGGWAKNRDIATTALGDLGTAHGGWQWRGDRYVGKNGLLSFTRNHCPTHSSSELEVQMRFIDWELQHTERRAGHLLQEASNLEEAVAAFMAYLRPAHFTWENPRGGHAFDRRLKIAKELMND
jgi:peptidoglycan L-alanyl-D-glutamate endopeptidase CwlK